MKNDVKLQILVSAELLKKLVSKILDESVKRQKPEGISAYVRNLIIKDVVENNE